MKFIYESPDGGKTVFRRPMGVPHAKPQLVEKDEVSITMNDEGSLIIIEPNNGISFLGTMEVI
jgi:hypothetical protein